MSAGTGCCPRHALRPDLWAEPCDWGQTRLEFEARFPRTTRASAFVAKYRGTTSYDDMVTEGALTVLWTTLVDFRARAQEFESSEEQELAWTVQAYRENVGYYGSDTEGPSKAELRWRSSGEDARWSAWTKCPGSY